MKLFNKTFLKFFVGFLAIVAGSITIAFIALYFSPESHQDIVTVDSQEAVGGAE